MGMHPLQKVKKILDDSLARLQSQNQIKITVLARLSFISSFLGDFSSADKYINSGWVHSQNVRR